MKENIKKILNSLVFAFIAFFIFGASIVIAETVMVKGKDSFVAEFSNISKTSDVIVLANDIDLSSITTKNELNIYKDKTIDLNGYSLTFPKYLIVLLYQTDATVKFIDSSSSKAGRILGTNITTGNPMINIANANKITNDDGTTTTETYLVFDGIKFEGNNANGSHAVGPFASSKIKKVSFINCNISGFAYLNDGREADNFYYENITFKRETGTGYLVSIGKKIDDVISSDSKIIKENTAGTVLEEYTDRNTLMTDVYTSNDVLKVIYVDGFTISNVSLKETLGYSSSTGKNITITNRGTTGLKIESVEVSDNAKFIIEEGNKDEIAAGASDNSWIIKARPGVTGGTYSSVITVKGSNGKSYSANVTLEVEEIEDGYKTVYVKSFDELKNAIDGIKYDSDGNYVTDTSIRKVKLGNNIEIPNGKTLVFYLINDFVLDLNGYTIDCYKYSNTIVLKYGNNTIDDFDNGGLTIIDSSASQSGSIKLGIGAIDIQQENLNDSAKNYKLIINGGKYYQSYGVNSYFINFNNSNTYWKDKNISFDFKVNKGYFEFENGISNGKILLAQDFVDNNQNVNLSLSFNNVTLKGRSGYLVYANDKEYTYNDITPDGTDLYIFNSAGKQKLIDDKSISAKTSVSSKKYMSDPDFSVGYYEGLKISRKQGFEVTAPTFDKVEYGYSAVSPKSISITNIGENGLGIQNVTVSSANGTKFEISTTGSTGIVEPNATDVTWTIYPVEGLNAGTHEAVITVTDVNGNTYTTTIKFVVEPKELTGLGISGLNSKIPFSDPINPTFTGIEGLSEGDYKVTYSQKDGDSYQEIFFKPNVIGSYKVTITITNENYVNISTYVTFDIVAKKIDPNVDVILNKTYTGSQIRPDDVYVRYNSYQFNLNEHFTLEYGENINVGTGTVIIKAIEGNNFTWDDKTVTFKIVPKTLTSDNLSLEQNSYTYTGSEIKPNPVVKDGEKKLTVDTDYEVTSYENNTETGTGTINVKFKGNYTGTGSITFSITAKEAQVINFNNTTISKIYGDDKFEETVNKVKVFGTIKYTSSNNNVAVVDETTGEVTIKGAGSAVITATVSETETYGSASCSYTLNVGKKDISFTAEVDDKEYDGNKNATIKNILFSGLVNGDTLTNTDYTVNGEFNSAAAGNNVNVKVTLTLNDNKNYNLTNSVYNTNANITAKSIVDCDIEVEVGPFIYNGTQIKPNVTVKDGGNTLNENVDYILEYGENINAGNGTIKISGKGSYANSINKTFVINKKEIEINVEPISDVTYNGNAHKPNVVVKIGTDVLDSSNYTVSYDKNKNAGEADVIMKVSANSNYTFGDKTVHFNINKYEIKKENIELEYTSTIYDGTEKKPTVIVKFNGTEIDRSNYELVYENYINAGDASVKITIKDTSLNYKGEVTVTYKIVNKTELIISGISDQDVIYTGNPVELVGTLSVSNGISPSDLNIKWYKDGAEIEKPTNVGTYKVVYSYEDDNYIGVLSVNVRITKKTSNVPTINEYTGIVNNKLSSITLPNGFNWVNENDNILAGNKEYDAIYVENNDSTNYTTESVKVKIYGKSKVNLVTRVDGIGGSISDGKNNLLEGTMETITFNANQGYIIDKVLVNGEDKTSLVVNNKLDITITNSNVEVVVSYKLTKVIVTINEVDNAIIDPTGNIEVDYGTDKVINIKAKNGYKLVSVKVNGIEKIDSIVDSKLTLENITENTEIIVEVRVNTYNVIEGDNQKYTITESNEAKFKIDADYSKFEKVYVDDELVDEENYTSESGSTIITLKKEYVDTLSLGEHTLKVVFSDGEAISTFKIAKAGEENPKTGDNIVLYIVSGIISSLSLAGCGFYLYKKKTN